MEISMNKLKKIKLKVLADILEKKDNYNDKLAKYNERFRIAKEGYAIKPLKTYEKEISVCERMIARDTEYRNKLDFYICTDILIEIMVEMGMNDENRGRWSFEYSPTSYIKTIMNLSEAFKHEENKLIEHLNELERLYYDELKGIGYYFCENCDTVHKGRKALDNCECFEKTGDYEDEDYEDEDYENYELGHQDKAVAMLKYTEDLKSLLKMYRTTVLDIDCNEKEVRATLEENKRQRPSKEEVLFNSDDEDKHLTKIERCFEKKDYIRLHFEYQYLVEYYYECSKFDEKHLDKCLEYCLKDFENLDDLDRVSEAEYRERATRSGREIKPGEKIFSGNLKTANRALQIYKIRKDYDKAIKLCDFLISRKRTEFQNRLESFEKKKASQIS